MTYDIAQLNAEVSRLRAALEQAKTEWQPIDTAPRDGTPILTVSPSGLDVAEWWDRGEDSCWMARFGYHVLPTRWIAIPDWSAEGGG